MIIRIDFFSFWKGTLMETLLQTGGSETDAEGVIFGRTP